MQDSSLYTGYCIGCVLIFFAGTIFIALQKTEDRGYLAKLFFFSLMLKLILVPVYYNLILAYDGDGFSFEDDRGYDVFAWGMAKAWISGLTQVANPETANIGYNYFNAWLYYIFGHNTLIARAANALISSMCIPFIYKLARLFFSNIIAKRAALILAFYPTLIYWSINQFKDSIIIFLTLQIVYLGIIFIRGKKLSISSSIILLLSMVLLYSFRYAVALPLFALLFIYFYFFTIKQLSIVRFVLVSLIIVLGLSGINRLTGERSSTMLEKFQQRLDTAQKSTVESKKGAKVTTEHVSSFGQIKSYKDLYKFPLAFLFVMIRPYPPLPYIFLKQYTLAPKILTIANFFYICILSYIVAGWWYLFKHKKGETFLLYFIPLFFLIIIAFSGTEACLRYREQYIPFYALLAAVGIEYKKNYSALIVSINIMLIIIAPCIYWILKII